MRRVPFSGGAWSYAPHPRTEGPRKPPDTCRLLAARAQQMTRLGHTSCECMRAQGVDFHKACKGQSKAGLSVPLVAQAAAPSGAATTVV